MIVRIWRGLTEAETADAYLEYIETSVLPRLRALDGFKGIDVLTHDSKGRVEFIVQTRWESMESIGGFAGEDPEIAVVEPRAQSMLVDWDRTVVHYTCHRFAD